jgi:hypothetical protein
MNASEERSLPMIPKRFSDEWFEMMNDWEGEHWKMVEEYHCWLKYRDVQGRLEEFDKEVQHRIYSGG